MPQRLSLNRTITLRVSATATVLAVSLLSAAGFQAQAKSVDVGPARAQSKTVALPARNPRVGKQPSAEQQIARYSNVLAKSPNNAAALLGRGKAYVSRRDYPLALADYNRAVQVAPQSKAAQHGRAAVCLLIQEQAAHSLAAAKPAKNSAAPVLDGSQFDDDSTIRAHVAPPAPTLARN